jgi:hypothetical protein
MSSFLRLYLFSGTGAFSEELVEDTPAEQGLEKDEKTSGEE